jgi:hypothetical protein
MKNLGNREQSNRESVGSFSRSLVLSALNSASSGPDDFNGYGYFYVRLYWTGFGLPANIVEEYILLSVLLHVFVGLKRTWDMKLALVKSQGINVLNLAISGLMLLTFMTIHLFQFRFGDTDQFGPYFVRPPPYLINFWGIPSLNLFWTDDKSIEPVGVRDIYDPGSAFHEPRSFPTGTRTDNHARCHIVSESCFPAAVFIAHTHVGFLWYRTS